MELNLTPNALKVLERRYLRKDEQGKVVETPDELFHRVADAIAIADKSYGKSEEEVAELADAFYRMMAGIEFMPNSPCLMNAGRELGQLSACFTLPIHDSMESIFETLKITSLIHKSGGGTGFSFSRLRPKNAVVKSTGGIASGPISFMKVYDAATEAVKQGGCVVPETRVATEKGLKQIKDLCDYRVPPKGWYMYNGNAFSVSTDEGIKKCTEFYNNGTVAVKKISTRNGYSVSATGEHRFRIIDEQGNYAWKKLKDIKTGDWVALQKGAFVSNKSFRLPEFKFSPHFNAKKIKIPSEISKELGEFIGVFIGDGSITRNRRGTGRLIFSLSDEERDLSRRLMRIMKTLFGINPVIQKKKDDASTNYFFNSTTLVDWLYFIGAAKQSALTARVPEIMFSGTVEFAQGFLRGLFSTDGTVSKEGYPSLSSISSGLIKDVQQLLLSLGIPTKIRKIAKRESSFGKNPVYCLSVITIDGLRCFSKDIGFIHRKKNMRLRGADLKAWEFNDIIPSQEGLLSDLYNGPGRGCGPDRCKLGANRLLYRDIQHYLPGVAAPRNLTRSRLEKLAAKHPELSSSGAIKWFLNNKQFYDQVMSISEGKSQTLDLSVPENNTYIANGFVSHNTRRGANMGILRVDHPDILEFITCKDDNKKITNFNISVAVTDEFMKKLAGQEDYDLIDPHTHKSVSRLNTKEVFDLIVKQAHKNGEPGIIFIDRINQFNPTPKLGVIESTNPCVIGDTLISTEKGLMRIRDIAKEYAEGGLGVATDTRVPEILYAYEGSSAIATKTQSAVSVEKISAAFKTGIKPVLRLKTKSGYELIATSDHKIMTLDGWVQMQDLKAGSHKVLIQPAAGEFNKVKTLPFKVQNEFAGKNGRAYKLNLPSEWGRGLGQVLGWLIGDGWLRDKDENCRVGFTFSQDDKAVLDYLKPLINKFYGYDVKEVLRENNVYHLSYHSKYFVEFFKALGVGSWMGADKRVPEAIFTATKEAVIGFLQGLFTADGTIGYVEDVNSYIRLTSKSLKLLKGVQILLLNLGIKSKIYDRSRQEREGFEYTTKNGETKLYKLDGICFELSISKDAVPLFLEKVGFLCDRHSLKVEKLLRKGYYNTSFVEEIKIIEPYGVEEVYDLTEPATHSFIANGIVISNCGEQPLLPYESCDLGSINLAVLYKQIGTRYEVDWERLGEVTRLSAHFLDNLIDVNKFPLPEVEKATKATRKIGLGVMGWASLLIRLGIPYNSEEAVALAEKVMAFVLDESTKKSLELGKQKGTFPAFKGSIYDKKDGLKLRNATLTTIAPTGTISIISGPCSSGIEPLFALSYFRNVMDNDKLVEVEPLFEEVAKARGFYSRELMEKIADGTPLHDIKQIPEDVKKVFVTAHDISPDWHVRMQAAFQKYVHNATSKTINFPNDATLEDVKKAYILAFELECKGITIYRDKSREEQVLNIGRIEEKKDQKIIGGKREIVPRPRPEVTIGTTTKVTTGCGNLYVTINVDEEGKPFELFTQMGKAGGCAASQLEAIGRLVSLGFRSGIEIKAIIEQLRNIRCPSPSWEKGQRIFSCADAIARIVEKRLVNIKPVSAAVEISQVAMKHSSDDGPVSTDLDDQVDIVGVCPDCGGALRHEEGCVKCQACGFSKC